MTPMFQPTNSKLLSGPVAYIAWQKGVCRGFFNVILSYCKC